MMRNNFIIFVKIGSGHKSENKNRKEKPFTSPTGTENMNARIFLRLRSRTDDNNVC